MLPDPTASLSPHEEARLCWRLRGRLLGNLWRQTLAHGRLRLALVLVLSVVFWLTLFLLFAEAFQFLNATIPLEMYEEVISSVFGLFFVSLMMMLRRLHGHHPVQQSVPLARGGLPAHDAAAAGTDLHPQVSGGRAVRQLGLPADGHAHAGGLWHVGAGPVALLRRCCVPFMVAFVYVPSAVGAAALHADRACDAHRPASMYWCWLRHAGCWSLAGWLGWQIIERQESDLLTTAWFQEMMGRLRFSQYRLLPSWWLSSGLLEASRRSHGTLTTDRPPWAEAVLFLGLIVSNALFLRQLAVWVAAPRVPRQLQPHSRAASQPQAGGHGLDRSSACLRWAFFLSPTMRLLIVKDLRLFRRDPVQWTQFLIFFGLLGLYFLNVRRFGYQDQNYMAWVNLISFLNLAVVGLILSTFTTRFIFPMISLEGRRFWILGLLPVRRETILWGKFLFAAIGSSRSPARCW